MSSGTPPQYLSHCVNGSHWQSMDQNNLEMTQAYLSEKLIILLDYLYMYIFI